MGHGFNKQKSQTLNLEEVEEIDKWDFLWPAGICDLFIEI
jgi:hypothetical protein